MRIITWNCNMAFRKKSKLILPFKPDILIVPECEHPDKLLFAPNIPKPTDVLWFGKNQHKGLAIFSYSNFKFKVLENHNKDIQLIIPIEVSDGILSFNLLAIWANNPKDKDGQYIEQIWKAIHYYNNFISDTNTILIGDFNSNKIWDKTHRESNHSNVVKLLEDKGIHSTYHTYFNQEQGAEKHPTLYMYRHEDKPYHIDYCFVSKDLLKNVSSVEVGKYEDWIKHSDHVPIIVDIEL